MVEQLSERVIAVQLYFKDKPAEPALLTEIILLAEAAGAVVIETLTATRNAPDAKTYLGKGKVEALKLLVTTHKVELIIFNHDLSPSQERNIEFITGCRVISRTGLILDIFAKRARTYEGKLQVELAQLRHLSTRLVGMWQHLTSQKGGIGLKGPGETQLETDRRLIKRRIRVIEERLEGVMRQRAQNRQARLRGGVPQVSLVGYTNAGKSTLFNAFTDAQVLVANQLFATLDPTVRQVNLPGLGVVVVADTVGFIRDLPHTLINAFRATLEETRQADVLLHVVDAASSEREMHIQQVKEVLQEIGAASIPTILVYNKADALIHIPSTLYDANGKVSKIWVSARTRYHYPELIGAIVEQLAQDTIECNLTLGPGDHSLRSELYTLAVVKKETYDDAGNALLDIVISRSQWERLMKLKGASEYGLE